MSQTTERIHELVDRLNRYRQEYYNENAPSVSDAVYDHLYDELARLEAETGIILSSSPTQTVGYQVVGSLPTVKHDIPLLSLDKTKSLREVISFLKGKAALLMLKLDGLTIKLVYEGGKLTEASTRGDGDVGEVITHNVAAFCNVPMTIPYQKHLEVSGEGFIHKSTFERLKNTLVGSDGRPYRNARNLASGSIRSLDGAVCKEREISFFAFHVLKGLDEFPGLKNSRDGKLLCLMEYGFGICPFQTLDGNTSEEFLQGLIESMQALADFSDIPIDGMVIRFEDLAYSESLGRTGHHYHDGIAFKFEDDVYETIFRSIEWQTGHSGEIASVAVFDTVEIDGCEVSRASSEATLDRFDFTCLEGIGDIMSSNFHKWFRNPNHLLLWGSLQNELHFENGLDAQTSGDGERAGKDSAHMNETTNNTFAGCTIVATGKPPNFTRDGINAKIISLDATPGNSVTKKTDYLICGEKAGSKLAKAEQLGVKILTEQEFLVMLSA